MHNQSNRLLKPAYRFLYRIHGSRADKFLFPTILDRKKCILLELIPFIEYYEDDRQNEQQQQQRHILLAVCGKSKVLNRLLLISINRHLHTDQSMRDDSRMVPRHPNIDISNMLPPSTIVPTSYLTGILPHPRQPNTMTVTPSI